MQLRAMKFARIEGTEVLVQVNTGVEAKAAIKELRHKKKEIALLKKRLTMEQKRERAAADRAERAREQLAKKRGFLATLRRVSKVFQPKTSGRGLPAVERDLTHVDEILHNIDSCIIQIEGRLLT